MNRVFADTHSYIALLNENDFWHAKANELAGKVREIVTTEYVLIEVGNSFTRSKARNSFPQFAIALYKDAQTKVVPGSESLILQSIELFAKYNDKDWSLTDCSSFVVMQELGLSEALTGDRHFAQAGFRVLLT